MIALAASLVEALRAHPYGLLYYAVALAASTFCCLPTTPFEIAAGFTWQLPHAIAYSALGKTIGSVAAFALSRLVLLPNFTIAERLPRQGALAASLSHLTGAIARRPLWIVTLIRAAPVPIFLKNYGLGMVRSLPMSTFVLVTIAVNVPFSIVWSLTGSSASSLQAALESGGAGSAGPTIARSVSAVVLLIAAGLLTNFCREQLKLAGGDGMGLAAARGEEVEKPAKKRA